jgi:hypothetical protein
VSRHFGGQKRRLSCDHDVLVEMKKTWATRSSRSTKLSRANWSAWSNGARWSARAGGYCWSGWDS